MTKIVTIDDIAKLPNTLDTLHNLEPLHIKLIGSQFHGSLTSSVMKGLIELQEGINRSYCLAKYGNADLRQLTDTELQKLELVVSIEEGCTDLLGNLQGLIDSLKELLKDMSPSQKFTIIMAIILGIVGSYNHVQRMENAKYISDNETKIALEQERTKQLDNAQKNTIEAVKMGLEHSKQENKEENKDVQENPETEPLPITGHFKILNTPTQETLAFIEGIQQKEPQISQTMEQAHVKFVRSMKFADTVVYHNTFEATGNMLEKITQTPRNTWQTKVLTDDFRVLRIDSSKIDYRTVHLRDDDGREFTARFTDKSINKERFNKLTSAMHGYNPINLSVRVKELDGKLKDGLIEQVREINTSRNYRELEA